MCRYAWSTQQLCGQSLFGEVIFGRDLGDEFLCEV